MAENASLIVPDHYDVIDVSDRAEQALKEAQASELSAGAPLPTKEAPIFVFEEAARWVIAKGEVLTWLPEGFRPEKGSVVHLMRMPNGRCAVVLAKEIARASEGVSLAEAKDLAQRLNYGGAECLEPADDAPLEEPSDAKDEPQAVPAGEPPSDYSTVPIHANATVWSTLPGNRLMNDTLRLYKGVLFVKHLPTVLPKETSDYIAAVAAAYTDKKARVLKVISDFASDNSTEDDPVEKVSIPLNTLARLACVNFGSIGYILNGLALKKIISNEPAHKLLFERGAFKAAADERILLHPNSRAFGLEPAASTYLAFAK